jgi:hypothetical protein
MGWETVNKVGLLGGIALYIIGAVVTVKLALVMSGVALTILLSLNWIILLGMFGLLVSVTRRGVGSTPNGRVFSPVTTERITALGANAVWNAHSRIRGTKRTYNKGIIDSTNGVVGKDISVQANPPKELKFSTDDNSVVTLVL